MKKLKLDLDTLAVDSYATQATEAATGTVAAHSGTILISDTVQKTIEMTAEATHYFSIVVC